MSQEQDIPKENSLPDRPCVAAGKKDQGKNIPQPEPQPQLQTTNMEVHKHPRHVTHKKKQLCCLPLKKNIT